MVNCYKSNPKLHYSKLSWKRISNCFLNEKHEWYDIRNGRISMGRSYFNRSLEFQLRKLKHKNLNVKLFCDVQNRVRCRWLEWLWYQLLFHSTRNDMKVVFRGEKLAIGKIALKQQGPVFKLRKHIKLSKNVELWRIKSQ